MSINTVDQALNFLPEAAGTKAATPDFVSALKQAFAAIAGGIAAARAYEELTARGIPANVAVNRVFADHFGTR
jgi:hypothetical protein